MSLYDDLGRDEAISAALDAFYVNGSSASRCRTAHKRPRSMGLDDDTTDVFLGHFRGVLVEFGVDQAPHVAAAMEIAEGARDDVLAR